MRALVVGATGVLGRHVIPRLMERGHAVRAVVRRAEQADTLRRMGVEAVLGDILDASSLAAAAPGCDVALHLATAIPRRGGTGDWSLNDRVRREGTANLLAAAAGAGVRRYVQQSITFMYGDQDTGLVDEETPLNPAALSSAADMERMVAGSALDWCILRGGAFYGPETGADEGWREQRTLPGDGSALVSLIHVADMASGVVLAAEAAPAGSIYNVVDDQPVSYRELWEYLATLAGAPAPEPGGPPMRSLGVSNARLRAELGWRPAYPSYRSGLAR